MSLVEENWQTTRATIKERSMFMFNNEILSDVSFVVRESLGEDDSKRSKKAIPAHKFILSISSPVFFAMFYGELAETAGSIDLPDCEYESLLELFRYMYSDEVNLNPDNVMEVFYLAQKYIMPSLADRCIEYLGEELDASSVFSVMDFAQTYEEKRLVRKCWGLIDSHTEKALKSDSFVTIERPLLESIVERNSLNVKEVELFKAVDRWATKECGRQSYEADGICKRTVLGDRIVKKIRFPVMEQKDFVADVLDSEILTSKEAYTLMKYYNSVLTSPVGFPEVGRAGFICRCCRFSTAQESGWTYEPSLKDSIVFSVDKDVLLHGLCLFGSENHEYSVKLGIYSCLQCVASFGSCIASKEGTFSSAYLEDDLGHYYGFDVLFDQPVALKKGMSYCVRGSISGPASWCGDNGICSVQCSSVTFNFKNAKGSDNGSSTILGQFPAFVFSLPRPVTPEVGVEGSKF